MITYTNFRIQLILAMHLGNFLYGRNPKNSEKTQDFWQKVDNHSINFS